MQQSVDGLSAQSQRLWRGYRRYSSGVNRHHFLRLGGEKYPKDTDSSSCLVDKFFLWF